MTIKYLKHTEIDKEKWDVCIDGAKNGLIYAYSWYLDSVSDNWDALITEDYKTVMPLIHNKKFFISYIYQPFFTQQSGVFSLLELTEETILIFVRSIPKKFKFVTTHLNYKNNVPSLKLISRKNFILNLNLPYKDLFSQYNENTKRNLKKARKQNLILKTDIPTKTLITFKKESLKINIPDKALMRLSQLIDHCRAKNCISSYGVYHNSTLVSAAFMMVSHRRAYYLISASTNEGKQKQATFLMTDEFIKSHAEQNLILDFEGSNIDGIAQFYKGWGAKNQAYYHFKENRLPLFLRFFKRH